MKKFDVISSKSDFNYITKYGKKFVCKGFVVFILNDSSLERFYIGWIVSSKNGNAVFRNRIKRRLRSLSSFIADVFNDNQYLKICYIAKKQSYFLNFDYMKQELLSVIKKNI